MTSRVLTGDGFEKTTPRSLSNLKEHNHEHANITDNNTASNHQRQWAFRAAGGDLIDVWNAYDHEFYRIQLARGGGYCDAP